MPFSWPWNASPCGEAPAYPSTLTPFIRRRVMMFTTPATASEPYTAEAPSLSTSTRSMTAVEMVFRSKAGTYPLPAPSPPLTHRLPSTSTSVWRGPRLRSDTCVVPSEPVLNLLFTPPPLHGMSCRKSPSVATPLAAISSRL